MSQRNSPILVKIMGVKMLRGGEKIPVYFVKNNNVAKNLTKQGKIQDKNKKKKSETKLTIKHKTKHWKITRDTKYREKPHNRGKNQIHTHSTTPQISL